MFVQEITALKGILTTVHTDDRKDNLDSISGTKLSTGSRVQQMKYLSEYITGDLITQWGIGSHFAMFKRSMQSGHCSCDPRGPRHCMSWRQTLASSTWCWFYWNAGFSTYGNGSFHQDFKEWHGKTGKEWQVLSLRLSLRVQLIKL